ncbi:protein PML-like isoform X2 [Eublepharis macularius]|nr:protein PML-like isoform X2 [Eublepharis macularius]
MEEEFQFLLCEKCKKEAQNPKLLSCLHTLCSECIEENKPIGRCPVCTVVVRQSQDNLLFTQLQASLNTYRKIATGKELLCLRCKMAAEFWCSECKELLCMKCYEAHQWYLKQKSHEAQKLEDVKMDSATKFLAGMRKFCTLFCSNVSHSNQGQIANIYCRQCCKPLCCSCAVLDNEHCKFYCDINVEIQQRKAELRRMNEDLQEKKNCYEQTYGDLQQQAKEMEKVRNKTQEQIREKVEEMVQWIRQKGEQLQEEVDKQMQKECEDIEAKLREMERVVNRMKTSKQLVEKMSDFASDQEVIDMHPFIKESLEELKKEKVSLPGQRVQIRNFAEIKNKLQALCDKVMGQKDLAAPNNVPPSAPAINSAVLHNEISHPNPPGKQTPLYTINLAKSLHGFTPSITTPRKRPPNQCEKSIQASPKLLKHEAHDSQEGETSAGLTQDTTTCISCSHEMTPEKNQRITISSADVDHSPPEIYESEVGSIVISSSEDTDVDTV